MYAHQKEYIVLSIRLYESGEIPKGFGISVWMLYGKIFKETPNSVKKGDALWAEVCLIIIPCYHVAYWIIGNISSIEQSWHHKDFVGRACRTYKYKNEDLESRGLYQTLHGYIQADGSVVATAGKNISSDDFCLFPARPLFRIAVSSSAVQKFYQMIFFHPKFLLL